MEKKIDKKWNWLRIRSGLLLVLLILSIYLFLNSCATAAVEVKTYLETMSGLNQDMRETLHKIREGQDVDKNINILHDQLHLMKDVLHLVKKGNEQDPNFQKLHELNHGMRESWHKVKRGRDREQNLQALHDRLHEMRETLRIIKGGAESHKGE